MPEKWNGSIICRSIKKDCSNSTTDQIFTLSRPKNSMLTRITYSWELELGDEELSTEGFFVFFIERLSRRNGTSCIKIQDLFENFELDVCNGVQRMKENAPARKRFSTNPNGYRKKGRHRTRVTSYHVML
uniref:Uncharacterized protein n=1 Tax=Megaselia scalaris TaxID=36166 RepID=T1GTL8_MEGSC